MKKHFYLTLLLALFSVATVWAKFAPEEGKMYALKETTSGLYLDIQTLGIKDATANCDNVSLNATPCVIYFEAGTNNGTWKLKNSNGMYVYYTGDNANGTIWNPRIGTAANQVSDWYVTESGGKITISREATGSYINVGTIEAGKPLYCSNSTGMTFTLMEISYSYELGDIKSSDDLMAATTATHIAVKNISSTNSKYYAGASNIDAFSADVVLVWEPVDGETGKFYLRTAADATNGYVQSGTNNSTQINLGAKTEAQVFYTAAPTVGGTKPAELASGTAFIDGADTDKLVRFVQDGGNTWLNVQGTNGLSYPVLGHTGTGNWTVHNVYAVNVTTKLTEVVFDPYVLLKTSSGTYLSTTSVASDTHLSIQAEGTKFVLETSQDGNGYYIKVLNSSPAEYVSTYSSNLWGASTSTTAYKWIISDPDTDGYVTISRDGAPTYCLGTTYTPAAGTAVYSNAGSENGTPNKWFIEEYNMGAVGYNFQITNPSGETVSATYNGNAITAGETIEIEGLVDKSLFDATDVEGYAWSVVVNNTAKTITLVYEKKYNWDVVGLPTGAAVTYNSVAVADGGIVGVDYDSQYLAVTCPDGYTWAVTRDNENKIITITFTQLQSEENPASVVALIKRIGGDAAADKFKFVLVPSLNYDQETFVIGSEDNKVLIKGTTISAITTGIGWYLQNIAHINIAWNSLNEKTADGGAYADLSSLPIPTGEETHTGDAIYRYYLNYCTFGYSMTTWTWKRWQQEIDWMALHGINMPLQIIGLEEVWRKFLLNYGYTNEEAKAFVPGPAFTAWWGMNNLEGWGGTAAGGWGGVQDDAWYTRQQQLATLILSRQRELGMQPVLPGWSAMVPTNFQAKSGRTTRANGGKWCGFTRPLLLSVSNSDYAEIAAYYYKCLKEVMGESQYYSMDPFHEYGGEGTTEDYKAIYEALEQAKPGAKWVIQQWEWRPSQKLCITAVPAGRLIVLDLFSDGAPGFDSYSGYAPQDAVFCAIPNYGGRSGLMGRLQNVTDNYFLYKNKYATIKGIGAAPEAIEQTPVTYDLIFQLPWMGSKPDVAEWVTNYSIARYGVENAEIQEAWSLLRQGPLNYGADRIQGPIEDVWAAVPNLTGNQASYWGKTLNNSTVSSTYTKARQQMLIDAVYKLLGQSESVADGAIYESNLSYDLVEFGGGVLADYAYYLLLGINEAKTAAGDSYNSDATYIARRDAFLALIADVDEFKGTNLNFRLGKWTQEARDAAAEAVELGATTADADWYELNNARTLITTWGDYAQSNGGGQASLRDYSYRSWQGLLKDLYLPRWQYYFKNNCTGPGHSFFYYGWNWAHRMEYNPEVTEKSTTPLAEGATGYSYSRNPEGNTVEVATEVLGKYIIPIKADDGAYYAYRYLTNDLTGVCSVIADAGQIIDLSSYFGELTNVTITGDFIDGTATDIKAVTVKADATDGSHTGTITLADGTVLTFAVVLNPAYNGVYKLVAKSYMDNSGTHVIDAPVFIAYNTDATDNPKSVGYKLMAKGTYSPSDAADDYFTIKPLGAGYSLQAQGLYVKAPQDLANWGHIIASEKAAEAGAYLFEETGTDTGIFKLMNSTGTNKYVNAWAKYLFGNEDATKYSTFTITEVTIYPVTIPANGLAINLPFNVVLPSGVTAYDVITVGDNENSEKVYETISLATAGGVVKAGTPMILKAAAGDYTLGVTVDNTGAVGSKAGSVLRGNFIKQALAVNNAISRYTFADAQFTRITTATELAGNSVYMELAEAIDTPIAEGIIAAPESPEHAELTALIGQLDELINKVADTELVHVKEEIVLSATEGEDGYITSNATEEGHEPEYLLDDNGETFFHTVWKGEFAEQHYLQIDLGEGKSIDKFVFEYQNLPTTSYNVDAANTIVVSGATTLDNFTKIETLSSLPTDKAATYTSKELGTEGVNYRYIRLTVTDATGSGLNGYEYFGMAEFELYEVTDEEETVYNVKTDYVNLRDITDSDINAAYAELQAAIATNASGTADEKEAAYQSLKALYDALDAKLQYIDEGVYTINDGGAPVFVGYRAAQGGLARDENGYHLFVPTNNDGATAQGAGALFTITHSGAGYRLMAQGLYLEGTDEDNWTPIFFTEDADEAGTYMFEATANDGKYKLKNNRTDIQYVNTYTNVYGNDRIGAVQSTFTLTPVTEYTVTVDESRYTTLCLPFNVVLPTGVTAYDVVDVHLDGLRYEYRFATVATEGQVLAKNTPVVIEADAADYVFNITMSDEDAKGSADGSVLRGALVKTTTDAQKHNYELAVVDGDAAFAKMLGNEVAANSCWLQLDESKGNVIYSVNAEDPKVEVLDGAVYRIKGRLSTGDMRTLYTNGGNKTIKWAADGTKDDVSTLFVAQKVGENQFKFVSVLADGVWNQDAKLGEDGVTLTLYAGSATGTFMLVGENNRLFCVDNEDLDFFSGAGIGGATVNENVTTDFVFEEEVERTYVKYTLTMAKDHQWATLYLPYEVVVPEGVEAYIAHTPDSEKMLLQPTGGVVPAYTPVVIYRDADEAAETKEYVFYYTAAAPAVAAEVENALTGKLIETVVEGKEDYRYYMLLTIGAEEAFYWILEEYDANGNLYPGVDKGYIKCAANKAFMALDASEASQAAYSFAFPGTTAVDGVEAEAGEVDAIYDLQGRKLLSAPEKGVYIVNGKLIVK